jgi:hypothetical protein
MSAAENPHWYVVCLEAGKFSPARRVVLVNPAESDSARLDTVSVVNPVRARELLGELHRRFPDNEL